MDQSLIFCCSSVYAALFTGLFFNNAKASLCIQMWAAVLFMLKSPWPNWRADSNAEQLIKRSKVHCGLRRSGSGSPQITGHFSYNCTAARASQTCRSTKSSPSVGELEIGLIWNETWSFGICFSAFWKDKHLTSLLFTLVSESSQEKLNCFIFFHFFFSRDQSPKAHY